MNWSGQSTLNTHEQDIRQFQTFIQYLCVSCNMHQNIRYYLWMRCSFVRIITTWKRNPSTFFCYSILKYIVWITWWKTALASETFSSHALCTYWHWASIENAFKFASGALSRYWYWTQLQLLNEWVMQNRLLVSWQTILLIYWEFLWHNAS